MTITTSPTATTISSQVAAEIRAWMGRLDIKQTQLAARLGEPRQWVSMRLTGKTPIGLDDLLRISEALGLSMVDLLPASARQRDKDVAMSRHVAPLKQGIRAPKDRRPTGHPGGSTRPSSSTRTGRIH